MPTAAPAATLPKVTLVVAMYNEAHHIAACLDSLVNQQYPADRLEIFVVDGRSTDESPAIVREYEARYPNVRMLDNPRRITPAAFNVGIEAASGDLIGIVSGHALLAPDYVIECVRYQEKTGADHVGGLVTAVGGSSTARAIGAATSTPYGVGDSKFHYDTREQFVDSLFMGLYKRDVFERIGLFDEALVRNQDDEFNYRLNQAGGTHFMTPVIQSTYVNRATYKGLWRQYFQYGQYKPLVMRKLPKSIRLRHLIPSVFALALIGSAALAPFWWVARLAFLLVSGAYLGVMALGGRRAKRDGGVSSIRAAAAFPVMHVAYGLGVLAGLPRALRSRGRRA